MENFHPGLEVVNRDALKGVPFPWKEVNYAVSAWQLLLYVPGVRFSRDQLPGPCPGHFVGCPAKTIDRALSTDHEVL
jgi:hypothetical protein